MVLIILFFTHFALCGHSRSSNKRAMTCSQIQALILSVRADSAFLPKLTILTLQNVVQK